MVPVSSATGAVGTGWFCGHRSVCTGNSVSGDLCSAVRMLLQPWRRKTKQEEAAEEDKGYSDLDVWRYWTDASG